jgi:hypothetical protein
MGCKPSRLLKRQVIKRLALYHVRECQRGDTYCTSLLWLLVAIITIIAIKALPLLRTQNKGAKRMHGCGMVLMMVRKERGEVERRAAMRLSSRWKWPGRAAACSLNC